MRRTPAVKTTTSLIERKIKQSSKHYYKLRISQAFPKLFQRTGMDPPRSGKKEITIRKERYEKWMKPRDCFKRQISNI